MPTSTSPSLFDSIAARLLRVIFGCYFVVTVIITCVQITLEYGETENRVLAEIQALDKTFGRGVAEAVWTYNGAGLNGILAGMMQQPLVIGVKVVNKAGTLVAATGLVESDRGELMTADEKGQLRQSPTPQEEGAFEKVIAQSFPVMYAKSMGSSPQEIGTWTIYSSERFVLDQVKFGFILLLINSVIKTLALWFIFLFVVQRLLGRPLQQLTTFVSRINVQNPGDETIVLQGNGRHELHLMADKLNELHGTLKQSVLDNNTLNARLTQEKETTQQLNLTLEARVEQRTEALAESNRELFSVVNKLQQTQSELVEVGKLASLGSLVAGVSHELNTPIGTALTTASTLEDEALKFKHALAEGPLRRSILDLFVQRSIDASALLVRSCHRAASLISSFKQVAVDQSSEHRRKFDLQVLIQDNLVALSPTLKVATWKSQADVPEGIVLDSYPGPLGQVIVNLVLNAGLHAFDGVPDGLLRISASVTNGDVEIRFADNGKGMSAETQARIFDPFFTTKLGQGGSGLGLAICHNIVTGLLGGTHSVTSTLGVGTTFVITLPLVAPTIATEDSGQGNNAQH